MWEVQARLLRERLSRLSPVAQYGTGIAIAFIPALLFALATVIYDVTRLSGVWETIALSMLALYVPLALGSLLCFAAQGFRWLGTGVWTAIVVFAIIAWQALQPVW